MESYDFVRGAPSGAQTKQKEKQMAKGEKIVQGLQAIVPNDEYIEAFKEGYANGFKQGYTNGYEQGRLQGFSHVAVQYHNPNLQQSNLGYQMQQPAQQPFR